MEEKSQQKSRQFGDILAGMCFLCFDFFCNYLMFMCLFYFVFLLCLFNYCFKNLWFQVRFKLKCWNFPRVLPLATTGALSWTCWGGAQHLPDPQLHLTHLVAKSAWKYPCLWGNLVPFLLVSFSENFIEMQHYMTYDKLFIPCKEILITS